MAIDFRKSEAGPTSSDIGNKEIQDRTVSKTVQMALFTTNENAVWAGDNALRKASYPLAMMSFPINRNHFRLEVGDSFKLTYSKYSISEMICRVLQISEENLESENITITAVEDVFSVTSEKGTSDAPTDHSIEPPDYTVSAIEHQNVIEAPYKVVMDAIAVIPMAAKVDGNELGYLLYMSSDDGASYSLLKSIGVFNPYGTLAREYPAGTYQIDDAYGLIVDFVNDDTDTFETITRQGLLGISNLAVVGNEIMTFQTITPISGGSGKRYHLTGIYRGRFDTEREEHSEGDGIFLADGENLQYVQNEALLAGTSRKFKFVSYNVKATGAIADSSVTELSIVSRSRKPYDLLNFRANGDKEAAQYRDDIVLTWSPRVRGDGAGFYAPTVTDKYTSWEGYFEIEVYVNDVLVRTKEKVDDVSWTYTEAMNTADNGSLAAEVVFKITNFIDYEIWEKGESEQDEITMNKI